MKPTVLLINPKALHWDRRIPFGLAYLAAAIRKDYEVKLIDMPAEGISEEKLIEYIREGDFGVVGITGMTHQILNAYGMIKLIKRNTDSIVVAGGCHATFCYAEALREGADFVVVGEGEETFRELLGAISQGDTEYAKIDGLAYRTDEGKVVFNRKRKLLDINELPHPARDLLPMEKYLDARIFGRPALEFMFGRGCPYNCIFCSSPKMWERRVRLIDLEKLIEEIKYVTKKYANRYIFITDDVFTLERKFVMDFCQKIRNMDIKWACISRVDLVDREMLEEMKESGCLEIIYGVESGNQRILDFEKKGITIERIKQVFQFHHQIGLPAIALMIVGHPWETRLTIQESIDLVKELNPFGEVHVQMLTPYVGTELYNSVAHTTGRIISDNWNDYLTWKFPPVFIPRGLDTQTICEAVEKFSKIKKMNFSDYAMAYRLAGKDILNWEFLFRPLIAKTLKRLLPEFMIDWVKWLRSKFNQLKYFGEKTEKTKYIPRHQVIMEMIKDISHKTFPRCLEAYLRKETVLSFISQEEDILDIGCGWPILPIYLAGRGHRVTAVDNSELAIKRATGMVKKYNADIRLKICDAQNLDFPNESFDLVIWEEVLEHLAEPLSALREGFRVLRGGGKIILSVPNSKSIRARIFRLLGLKRYFLCPDHKQNFSQDSICRLVKQAGFRMLSLSSDFIPVPKLPLALLLNKRKAYAQRHPSLGHHLIVYAQKPGNGQN